MSYSAEEAQMERDRDLNTILQTRDSEGAYRLSHLYKEEGDDELAEALQKLAKRWDKEDDAYDQHRDNQL